MSRQRSKRKNRQRNTSAAATHNAPFAFLKSTWFVVTTTAGLLGYVLLNGPAILDNARKLPASFEKTRNQFLSWVYEDDQWAGYWTSFPEGEIDMESMNLSDVDLEITIWPKQGQIDGVIATKSICKVFPIWAYVLLRGEVSGNSADVVAFDFIGGIPRDFAKLRLTLEDNVMTVVPLEGRKEWFPARARIARLPSSSADPEPDMQYCSEERKVFMDRIRSMPEKKHISGAKAGT